MRHRNPLLLLLVVALPLVAVPSLAHAQDIEKQVNRMNKKAMEDYDSLEFESARKTLIDAVAMLRANGLDETPLAAKTFLNLGMLYISGFKDKTRGQQQFVNAIKIKNDVKLDPALATPELDEAFAAAQKQAGVANRPKPVTPKPVEPPKPPKPEPVEPPKPPVEEVHGLQHNPVDESRPNTVVPIRAQLGSDVGATRVFLFYRGGGQEDFVSVPMKNTGGAEWSSVIPADAVTGRAIQYYLEARDQRGRAVVGSGSAPNPYIIAITETAPPPSNVPEVDVEDPLAQERLRKKREAEERRGGKLHRVFIFLLGGFGFGFEPAGNHTEVAYQYQPSTDTYVRQPVGTAGVAFSPFHLGFEAGGMLTKNFSLSAIGRFEVFTDNNAETVNASSPQIIAPTRKATSAFAGLVRARYRFLEGRFHPYVQINVGGGQIRHSLDISSAQTSTEPLVDGYTASSYNMAAAADRKAIKDAKQQVCPSAPESCKDTIALGYLLVGGGGGLWIDIHKYLALLVDLNLLGAIGVGDGQSGMNIDFQLGFGAHF